MIRFSPDSNALVFTGVDPAGLYQLKNTPNIDTAYSDIISVLELPSEDDSTGVEQSFAGKVVVGDSVIVFHPHVSFAKGKSYLVISFLNAKFGNAGMMLTGKLDHKVKPQEVILKR